MANPIIKIKRSAVAGKIPTTTDLQLGELAINTYDGKVYIEQDQGGVGVGTTVIVINPWSVGTGTNTYNTYFTAGSVGVGTTNPSATVTSSNTAVLAAGIVTAYKFYGDGAGLTNISVSGISTIGMGTVPPTSPTVGTVWYNTNLGRTFVYYNDGSSLQWVDVAPFNQGGTNSTVTVSSSAPTSPVEGQLWYSTLLARTFIYYSDGTSSQWVDAAPFNTQVVNRTLTIGTRTTAKTLTLVGTGLTISLRSGIGTASF